MNGDPYAYELQLNESHGIVVRENRTINQLFTHIPSGDCAEIPIYDICMYIYIYKTHCGISINYRITFDSVRFITSIIVLSWTNKRK